MGPNERRLRESLAPASSTQVDGARQSWSAGAVTLNTVRRQLDMVTPLLDDLGDQTGRRAAVAFAEVRARLDRRYDEMQGGSEALLRARDSLIRAEGVRDGWDADGALTPPREPDWSSDEIEQLRQSRVHNAQRAAYQAQYDAREAQAEQTMRELDTSYRDSADAMRRVHGEAPAESTGGGGSTTTAGGGARPAVGGGGGSTTGGGTYATGSPGGTDSGGTSVVGGPAGSGYHAGPALSGPGFTGTPQGGTPLGGSTTGGLTGAPSAPAGATGAPALGGVVGALGGGLAGGLTGITGAVRGSTAGVVPTGTSAAATRALGSSARTATAGALGRAPGASAAAGRSATSTSTATGSTRAGSTARGAAGTRGAAGGRGTAGSTTGSTGSRSAGTRGSRGSAGTGATGRNRKRDDERGRDSDFLDDGHEWVDDEGVAPGVID